MSKTLHFKIVLIESKPLIWRSFKVTDDYRFDRFHQVLQIVMGWTNSHLHDFNIKGREIGMFDENYKYEFPKLEDETKVYLRDLNLEQRDTFTYRYDFGDCWEHVLYVETAYNTPLANPICIDGEKSCPPEDCGGVHGYANLLEILKDTTHLEHDEYVEWLPPGFNPNYFSKDAINKELEKFGAWHKKHPRKKSTPWHQLD